MRALVFITLSLLISTSASAGTITFKGCSASDQSNIKQAVQWLKDNISKIDAKMGKGALMSWPGNSRKKWLAKLDKDLKFVCKNAKKKCQRVSKSGTVLYGQVVPVFQQKTVQLCTNHFTRGMSDYVGTIAHGIGHLVRLNAHRTNCKKLCEKPRFSQSVGIAAEIAYTGGSYSAKACKKSCD